METNHTNMINSCVSSGILKKAWHNKKALNEVLFPIHTLRESWATLLKGQSLISLESAGSATFDDIKSQLEAKEATVDNKFYDCTCEIVDLLNASVEIEVLQYTLDEIESAKLPLSVAMNLDYLIEG
jgi:hypothetical protein